MRIWLAAAALLGLSGCTAFYYETGPAYSGAYVSAVPVGYELYPRVWYRGGYAYYVHNTWYHHSPHGWAVMQHGPPRGHAHRAFVQHGTPHERPRVAAPARRGPAVHAPAQAVRGSPAHRATPARRAPAASMPVLRPRPAPMRRGR